LGESFEEDEKKTKVLGESFEEEKTKAKGMLWRLEE